ncbi:MAG: 50S ribosomal protein L4 [Nitrospinae bacterium]|nr:50S ribosomal protein L4 [Nitrospinota bacterium]
MKTKLYNQNSEVIGEEQLKDDVFAVALSKETVSFVVKWQLAKRRSGNASTKGRSEVKGSGKKPYKQKGTGRARAGSIKSPLWRGGGITFGPKPRDYSFSIPKTLRKNALKQVLSDKVANESFYVVDNITFEQPKTKDFNQLLEKFNFDRKVLLVDGDKENVNLYLSLRNVPGVNILPSEGLNVYDVLFHDVVLCTQKGLRAIEERLSCN